MGLPMAADRGCRGERPWTLMHAILPEPRCPANATITALTAERRGSDDDDVRRMTSRRHEIGGSTGTRVRRPQRHQRPAGHRCVPSCNIPVASRRMPANPILPRHHRRPRQPPAPCPATSSGPWAGRPARPWRVGPSSRWAYLCCPCRGRSGRPCR